jgi:hypothetical protein
MGQTFTTRSQRSHCFSTNTTVNQSSSLSYISENGIYTNTYASNYSPGSYGIPVFGSNGGDIFISGRGNVTTGALNSSSSTYADGGDVTSTNGSDISISTISGNINTIELVSKTEAVVASRIAR